MKIKHRATVNNNIIIFSDDKKFRKEVASHDGKEVYVTIGAITKTRSNNQNRYYWKCIVGTLADELGYLPEEMHDTIKYLFLRKEVDIQGKKLPKIGSTKELTTKQWEELMSRIRSWASTELGIGILQPNEVDLDTYGQ